METVKAPGLKYRKLASGRCPIWVADEADVKRGYTPKTVNLKHLSDHPDQIIAQCHVLQAQMLLWRTGYRPDPLRFDGTIESVLSIYQRHEDSPFHRLKPGTLKPYKFYLAALEQHIGKRRIDAVSGLDIMRWHRQWSSEGKHLAAAAMTRCVLESAVSFGVAARLAGCADLSVVLKAARKSLPRSRPRDTTLTADQIVAARAAAHAAGRPSSALAYAVVFETTIRLWDVIGQWYPMDRPEMSDVFDRTGKFKWFGLRWEDVDANDILRFTPSKTENMTGLSQTYSLQKAPMVMEELRHWPEHLRTGPMIRSEATGHPYRAHHFGDGWRKDRKAAGIPSRLWLRDMRASGISEGRAADASLDDASKVAGHASKRTTGRVYDRAVLEAADRFADARLRGRKQSGNADGNGR